MGRAHRNPEIVPRSSPARQAINVVETGKHDPSLTPAFALTGVFDLKIEDVFDPTAEAD